MRHDDDREQLRHVRRPLNLPLVAAEGVVLLLVVALATIGLLAGILVGHEGARHGSTTTVTVSTR